MAAFRPTRTFFLGVNYDLYPPRKVVSCFKGAVPPLNNSHGFLGIGGVKREAVRLNFYPVPRQPAITRFDWSVTTTQSFSHSFATETGWPCIRLT